MSAGRPRTSRRASEHRVYPYLLRNARVTRPNQVWAADITYNPMARGFLYLVAVMDWHSRYVLSWRLSNTLEAGFCAEALVEALDRGRPEVFNADQGEPVHQSGVHPGPSGPRCEDQHGREGEVRGERKVYVRPTSAGIAAPAHQVHIHVAGPEGLTDLQEAPH